MYDDEAELIGVALALVDDSEWPPRSSGMDGVPYCAFCYAEQGHHEGCPALRLEDAAKDHRG